MSQDNPAPPPASTDNEPKPLKGWQIALIVFVVIIVLIIIILTIMAQFKRYSLIGQAIGTGQAGTAMTLASPEIGAGIGNIFSGFRGRR